MRLKALVASIVLPVVAGLLTVIEFAIACFPNTSESSLIFEPIAAEPDFYR